MESPKRLIIGISGASGIIYGIRALQMLQKTPVRVHLVVSKAAELTLSYETNLKLDDLKELADEFHPVRDIGASIASGSFRTSGMLILPCSIRTMSELSSGVTSSLLSRAADVVLKEKRRLVLGIRETPLHGGHLKTMLHLAELGVVISPIVPAFYNKPQTLDDIINQTVGRMLDMFDIDLGTVHRWRDEEGQ